MSFFANGPFSLGQCTDLLRSVAALALPLAFVVHAKGDAGLVTAFLSAVESHAAHAALNAFLTGAPLPSSLPGALARGSELRLHDRISQLALNPPPSASPDDVMPLLARFAASWRPQAAPLSAQTLRGALFAGPCFSELIALGAQGSRRVPRALTTACRRCICCMCANCSPRTQMRGSLPRS